MVLSHLPHIKEIFSKKGYQILNNIYTEFEIDQIIKVIETNEKPNENFRKEKDLFAIRSVINEIPPLKKLVFNNNITQIINEIGDRDFFVIKSIYFDKPETSNWVVPYHQDLTINLKEKIETVGFHNWTKKNQQVATQPTIDILENIFTIRIHLDDTTKENGAVKVIPTSHLKGIIQLTNQEINKEDEFICEVPKGGIMLMKPLTLHASTRTTNNKRRRVLHIEFCNKKLFNGLKWSEYSEI